MTQKTIWVTSGVSVREHKGFVSVSWGDEVGQLTIAEARQHALAILECCEAAEQDAAAWAVAQQHLEMDDAQAGAYLVLLRQARTGQHRYSARAEVTPRDFEAEANDDETGEQA